MRRQSRAFRRIPRRARRARGARPRLSRASARARRSPPRWRSAKRTASLAARSGRRAALSRAPAAIAAQPRRAQRASQPASPRLAPRHGAGAERHRAAARCIAVSTPDAGESSARGRSPGLGRRRCSPARRCRRATTSRSWSTTRCRASPMWCAERTSRPRPIVHVLLQELLGLPAPRYRHHPLICDPKATSSSKSRRLRIARGAAGAPRRPHGRSPMVGAGAGSASLESVAYPTPST